MRTMIERAGRLALPILLLLWATPIHAREACFDQPVGELQFTEGRLSTPADEPGYLNWRTFQSNYPRVLVDGGEGYVTGSFTQWDWPGNFLENARVVVCAPAGAKVTGSLLIPDASVKGRGMRRLRFTIPKSKATAGAVEAFAQGRRAHYERLLTEGIPGGAWFRLQADLGKPGVNAATLDLDGRQQRQAMSNDELHQTYDLFTGSRALSENLQLDRVLSPRTAGEATVALDTLEGITVEELDWTTRNQGKAPRKDPLAAWIPADQHALFFPTFSDLISLSDEADAIGTPVLAMLEVRSEESGVKQRYQEQLCLSMSALSRLLGPSIVASVAFTGSDPYLRLGSDIAILFEAKNPALLVQHIRNKQDAARSLHGGLEELTGEAGGLTYRGVCSKTRAICSYVAVKDDVVVVTNSLAQLARIGKTGNGAEPALGGAPEYTFFRDRYPLGAEKESAFLILPDAAIRRWCGPRWRIADSRRLRVLAVLSHLHALNALTLQTGKLAGKLNLGAGLPDIGKVEWTEGTLHATDWGTLSFLTPIIEMEFDQVTEAEADAYNWFRNRYQNNWRAYFDPIGIRFYLDDAELSMDVTVMPLIAASDYRELIELTTGGESMEAEDGDPHPEVLFRYGMSLNPNSRLVRQVSGFAVTLAPGLKANVISWLGSHVEIYGDRDPFWAQLVAAPKKEDFIEKNFHRLPVAIQVGVSSPLQVTAFLATVRAFIEQSAPGMTLWEVQTFKGLSYVKVSPAQRWDDDLPMDLAIYYAVADKALTLTLHEDVLKRSLARAVKRTSSPERRARVNRLGEPWRGRHVGFQADGETLELAEIGAREELIPELQARSWGNLTILNEWKRVFPDADPVAVHQRLWGTRLTCPGGGEYAWNAEWRTMESTAYGHPGQPKDGPGLLRPPLSELAAGNFGLTFEDDGLRARAELRRGRHKGRSLWGQVLNTWCSAHPGALCELGSAARYRVTTLWGRLPLYLPW
ncbi:MAG: hypothetical protein ABIK09_19110 [Pseudomonadota bacterium]